MLHVCHKIKELAVNIIHNCFRYVQCASGRSELYESIILQHLCNMQLFIIVTIWKFKRNAVYVEVCYVSLTVAKSIQHLGVCEKLRLSGNAILHLYDYINLNDNDD